MPRSGSMKSTAPANAAAATQTSIQRMPNSVLLFAAQCELHAEPDEKPADAAAEPAREPRVSHQDAADARRGPRDEKVPQRAVQVEERAEKEERGRLAR